MVESKYQKMNSNASTKFEIPPSLEDLPFNAFMVSKRLSNVLKNLNLNRVGDLKKISVEEFFASKHCGERTVRELLSLIEEAQNSRFNDTENVRFSFDEFVDIVEQFLTKEKEPVREILIERYGGRSPNVLTLEQLGREFGVTRERIRQIATSAIEKIATFVGFHASEFYEQLARECDNGIYPVTPTLWFQRAGKRPEDYRYQVSFYVRILGEVAPSVPVFIPDSTEYKRSYVKPLSPQIFREAKKFLLKNSSTPVKVVFEGVKSSGKVEKLSVAQFFSNFRGGNDVTLDFSNPVAPTMRLVGEPTTRDMALAVLSESECVLKPEEIISRAREMFGEAANRLTVFGLLGLTGKKHGFYLLNTRSVGLRKHLTSSEKDRDRIRNDFYKFLRKTYRTYSTKEVVAQKLIPTAAQVNPYELAFILRSDRRFRDLGRLHFALRDQGIRKREKIADMAIDILREADRPLQAIELFERLKKRRSVSASVFPALLARYPMLKQYDHGFYGLEEWGNDQFSKLLSNETFIFRFLTTSETPLKFGDMCKRLGIEKDQLLVKILWERLLTMPKADLRPRRKAPSTLVLYNSIAKIKFRKKNFPEL